MTVWLHDVRQEMGTEMQQMPLSELVYADDTMLVGTSEEFLQKLMEGIGQAGRRYGLSFNWAKLEAMTVRIAARFTKPDGKEIKTKQSLLYLGSSLGADGRNGSEINRRLGMARADFDTLSRIWSHASMKTWQKLNIFRACILSKLSYGLMPMCLSSLEERRLDGFQCRCLRRIIKVAPSYYSRVSNETIYRMTRELRLSSVLKQQRMLYLGVLARRGSEDVVRRAILEPGSLDLRSSDGPRKRGRPRKAWARDVMRDCLEAAKGQANLEYYCSADPCAAAAWRRTVLQGPAG